MFFYLKFACKIIICYHCYSKTHYKSTCFALFSHFKALLNCRAFFVYLFFNFNLRAMVQKHKPNFNKRSAIYNITYVTGRGINARTFRWQLGQQLPGINSCIYDIIETVDNETNDKTWVIYSYNHTTHEILEYRTTTSYDEITANQAHLLNYE